MPEQNLDPLLKRSEVFLLNSQTQPSVTKSGFRLGSLVRPGLQDGEAAGRDGYLKISKVMYLVCNICISGHPLASYTVLHVNI